MPLQPIDALRDVLHKTQKPLLFLPEHPDGDSIAAAWAISLYMRGLGATPTVAVSDPFDKKARFGFLPKPEQVLSSLAGSKSFVLIFDTTHNPIADVVTDRLENEVRITLTPEKGAIDPRDFSFVPAELKYDLILTFGCSGKESIGALYEECADIFYELPVVNFDCRSENESFGQINMVDMTASSVSEVVATTLLAIDDALVANDIAQCLLAGVTAATDSFQHKNTTPNALHLAAQLIERGANQQQIVQHLYKTQPLGLIKLWGRVMAKLQWDETIGLVWAQVTIEDFVQSRMHPNDLPTVVEKIKSNYASGKIFLLLYEQKSGTTVGIVKFHNGEALAKKLDAFGYVSRGEYGEIRLENTSREEAEKKIVETLKG